MMNVIYYLKVCNVPHMLNKLFNMIEFTSEVFCKFKFANFITMTEKVAK